MSQYHKARNDTVLKVDLNVNITAFDYVYSTAVILFAVCVTLCLLSCLFGLISWILIPQWRKFRNYVFMNVFFVTAITMSSYFVVSNVYPKEQVYCIAIVFMFVLSRIVMCHWLFVATVMFYMDIVKVFHAHLKRKYLVVNLFAWFLPVVEVCILFSVSVPLKVDSSCILFFTCAVLFVLLLATGVLYLRVLCTLLILVVQSIGCKKDLCQKIILCTVGCVTSGISTFMPVVISEVVFAGNYVVINSICIVSLLHIITIVLFFLIMKRHREAWAHYLRRRRSVASLGESACS